MLVFKTYIQSEKNLKGGETEVKNDKFSLKLVYSADTFYTDINQCEKSSKKDSIRFINTSP